jgi:hypothetical protein
LVFRLNEEVSQLAVVTANDAAGVPNDFTVLILGKPVLVTGVGEMHPKRPSSIP